MTTATAWWNHEQIEARTAAPGVEAANYGFDVTPACFVTGIITERGIAEADEALLVVFPQFAVLAD